jgi:hypothetical protein
MSEDAPVNIGVSWPDAELAGALVRSRQTKLAPLADQRVRHVERPMR